MLLAEVCVHTRLVHTSCLTAPQRLQANMLFAQATDMAAPAWLLLAAA